MTLYGLIGYPLGHSFSRKYFTDKFNAEQIPGHSYELFAIEKISMLPMLVAGHPQLSGLNVTIPYKKEVLDYLDDTSNLPAGLNACNCIRIRNGKLTGYNTDVAGFRLSLQPLLQQHHRKALILGNGGATAAVKYALQQLDVEYSVVSRSKPIGDDPNAPVKPPPPVEPAVGYTYEELNETVLADHHIIINTTPLGTYPDVSHYPQIPYEYITSRHLLYDLVYNPELTVFMQKGAEKGAIVKNGYDMLVIQAEESWKIWNS